MSQGFSYAAGGELRLRQLEENIRQDLALLNEYETELRLADDPRARLRYEREIERQRGAVAAYNQEYTQLRTQLADVAPQQLAVVGAQLQQMNGKLDALLAGQDAIRQDIGELRAAVLARVDAQERPKLAGYVDRLDAAQLVTVGQVMDAADSGSVSPDEIRETLAAVRQALTKIEQRSTSAGGAAPDDARHAAELIGQPHLDTAHKLKLTVPIIPLLLSYEGEVGIEAGVNLKELKEAWGRLVSKVRRGR